MPFSSMDLAEAGVSLALSDVGDVAAIGGMQKKGSNYKRNLFHTLSYGLSSSAALAAILAMIASSTTIAYLAMSLSLLMSNVALLQRFFLSRQDTFRQVHNRVREEVNRLQRENFALTGEVNRLARQAQRVERVEGELQSILSHQKQSTDSFVSLVKQNRQIQSDLKEALVTQILQSFLSVVLMSDLDRDFQIDPEEVNILLTRVRALPGVEGVEEERVKHLLLHRGNGLEAVYNLVHDLTDEEKRWVTVSCEHLRS